MSLLTLERVTKRFDGIVAVDEVSFDIDRGQVVGFLSLTASTFPTTAQADSIDFTRPDVVRARLLSAGGAPLVHLVFDSTANRVWTRADSGGIVFGIDRWTFSRLAPGDSTLRVRSQ